MKTAKTLPQTTTGRTVTARVTLPGPSERTVMKVSPLKGMAIEDYAAQKVTGWQSEAVRRLAALIARVAPTATAAIKWGQPVFEENGPFAYVRPARAHVTFGFWRGMELDDPKGILTGDGDRMRHLKLTALDQIDEAALGKMVQQAVALNREKGSPAMRSK